MVFGMWIALSIASVFVFIGLILTFFFLVQSRLRYLSVTIVVGLLFVVTGLGLIGFTVFATFFLRPMRISRLIDNPSQGLEASENVQVFSEVTSIDELKYQETAL